MELEEFKQLIKIEFKSITSSFTVLNRKRRSKINEAENKRVQIYFITINSYIKLYGELEKQI